MSRYSTLYKITVLLTILVFCSPALNCPAEEGAAPNNEQRKLEKIFHFYGQLSSLSFDFSQQTETTARTRSGKGDAVFFRPALQSGLMRWNYDSPDRQVVINDGNNISIYTENDQQMIVTPAAELESDITYQLLNGNTEIINDFNAVVFDPSLISSNEPPYPSIELTPLTPQNQLKTIRFWHDDHNIIHQIVITDHFETITTLRFTNIKINDLQADDPAALSTILNFTPPPGTEIIRHQ